MWGRDTLDAIWRSRGLGLSVDEIEQTSTPESEPSGKKDKPSFAHISEAAFARVLDFYQVDWEYEPHSFPLRWNEAGEPVEYFTPDFYLKEFDLYIELTTLRQKLVTRKNRKLRRLRELYPNVQIKLFYSRDVRKFLSRYGVRLEQS